MGLSKSAAFAFAGLVFACTACGSAATQATGITSTTVPTRIELNANGFVNVGVPSLPTNFNPATVEGSNQVTAMVMAQVLPQTFLLNNFNAPQCPENVSSVCEGLLAGVDPAELVSNSPQTVVYHLASRASWSDGVPITVADFIYNWKMQVLAGPSLPATDPIGGYEDISNITGSAHGKTVTVVFYQPYADWQALFTNLIPAHIAKDFAGWNTDFVHFPSSNFVSGGPFKIAKIVPGRQLVLVRNRDYWGPPARVAGIVFNVEQTRTAMLHALATGRIDMGAVVPGLKVENTVVSSTSLIESTQPGPILYQLDFNLADPTLADLNLRQAIAEAIDRHQIVSDTAGLLTPFNNVAANHLFPYGFQGSQPNDSTYEPVNLAQAQAQLVEAGYTIGIDGIARSVFGQPLVLSLVGPSGNDVIANIEDHIQAELLQIGIEVKIDNVSSSELLANRLPQGNYQLAIAPYLMSQFLSTNVQLYTNPVGPVIAPVGASSGAALAPTIGTSLVTPHGTEPAAVDAGAVTRDILGYDDPRVVQLFDDASQELNAGAFTTYNQIDTAIWAELPALPLFQMPVSFVWNVRVLNIANSQGWLGPMWNAQNWAIQSSPPPTTTTTLPS
ncbi:MAG TPA: ABC transporter family substrate-binding protein [Acidimicrobiales bacterium]|nr:ABC transporter family substrate-binding protein [Acidimicrobiales bacterium]